MSDIAIQVEGLGKRYRLGERHKTNNIREAITNMVAAPFRGRWGRPASNGEDVLWALRDVSFSVKRGEVMGIVGKNGAGKSTLLKVLSRITEPTEGVVTIHGRVGSLLEVGTGFHPELTGRENIFLNGAILGMKRGDINRRFDEIVAFSEVEKFLDTPVKRYSSGMYMRLAFAVAAHLDPEILVVDEVLAVGDAEFQKKCLGKMQEAGKSGRTVLFVSHNMDAVAALCTSAIVMEKGRNTQPMPPPEAVTRYLSGSAAVRDMPLRDRPRFQVKPRPPIITGLEIKTQSGEPSVVPTGTGLEFELTLSDFEDITSLQIGLIVSNTRGQRVAAFQSMINSNLTFSGSKHMLVRCAVPSLPMVPDTYHIDLVLWDGYQAVERLDQAATVTVVFRDLFGTGRLPMPGQGFFALPARWSVG